MNSQDKKQKRKRRGIAVVIALSLIIGFLAGVVCTIILSQNYTVVIKENEKTTSSEKQGEQTAEKVPDVEKKEPLLKETQKENEKKPSEEISEKKLVVIDAGHQQKGNSEQEPIAPGSSQTKAKVASGTAGVATEIPEYQVNLEVSLILEKELRSRGYDVIMIRSSNDVDISNSQRAMIANDAGADAFIRIHCNGSEISTVTGALTMCQTSQNQYCGDLYASSRALSEQIINSLCIETGAKNLGVSETDTMSGINWCRVPVTIVEMGFMSNPEEDRLLCDTSYQKKLATGIANGIDAYFGNI